MPARRWRIAGLGAGALAATLLAAPAAPALPLVAAVWLTCAGLALEVRALDSSRWGNCPPDRMSVLRSIEQKIEGLFEGMFGRAFRTHVQPVELARKLAKEMDEHRTISVSRVYVPNEYSVYLSEADREQFTGYEGSLIGELQDYLVEHARRESYALLTPPKVLMQTDDDLSIGEFGIATRVVQPEGKRGPALDEPAAQVEPGATMIYKAKPPQPTEAASPAELGVEQESFSLTMNGRKHAVEGGKVVLGRSKDCDVQVEDANVSRRHAELRREGSSWWLVDLDSTNGTELNGKRVQRMQLADGDTITLGATDLVFERIGAAGEHRRRRGAADPQDRLHRAALPLHLADRAQREPRLPHGARGGERDHVARPTRPRSGSRRSATRSWSS